MRVRARLALVALAGALTAGPAAASGAAADVDCGFNTVAQEQVTGGDGHYEGVGHGHATLTSPDLGPVTARVTCLLMVDGVPRASFGGEGTGVVAFAEPLAFDLTEVEYAEPCWEVDFLSDDTPTQTGCVRTDCYWPPEGWCPVEFLFPTLDEVFATVDGTTCPVLAALPDLGPVTTDDEGDVHHGDEVVWDCPPFGNGRR